MAKILFGGNFEIKDQSGKFQLIGWHDPYGTFEIDGKEWKIAVVGGVREVWITHPDGRRFSIDIGDIVSAMVDEIKGQDEAPADTRGWGHMEDQS